MRWLDYYMYMLTQFLMGIGIRREDEAYKRSSIIFGFCLSLTLLIPVTFAVYLFPGTLSDILINDRRIHIVLVVTVWLAVLVRYNFFVGLEEVKQRAYSIPVRLRPILDIVFITVILFTLLAALGN